MEQNSQARRLRFRWTALILSAVLPLFCGAALLQILAPPGGPLSAEQLLRYHGAVQWETFLPNVITYVGLVTIHCFCCAATIAFAWLVLGSLQKQRARKLKLVGLGLGLSVSTFILILASTSGERLAALRLSYFNFESLFFGTGPGKWLLEPQLGLTTLGLAAYVPTVLGIFAVALTAAAAVSQLSLAHDCALESEEAQENMLCLLPARLKRLTYALSLVLVTSTVAAALYFQLPAKLLPATANLGDFAAIAKTANERIVTYGSELTMFWGGIYTLTLFMAVGLPLLLVQKRVRDFLEALHPPDRAESVRERLTKAGVLSGGGDQAKVLLAFVAPLVSGPVTGLLQAAAG